MNEGIIHLKALVTGASGFLGSHIVETLCAAQHDVRGLVRTPEKARLVESLGGKIQGIAFVIELGFLDGRKRLSDYELLSLVRY